ncbi:MAG TPA: hypothetical protein VEY93_03095, partial [Longimicrobium sp.]|nr:hypothetical protein [Longimicrobium sp.]
MSDVLRRAPARRLMVLAVLALPACGGKKPPPVGPPPPVAVAPMDLGGQQVVILPVQQATGVGFNREQITAEIVTALQARDAVTQWITPERLRHLLRQSPGYAPDPAALPNDSYQSHGERRVAGALADPIRRYAALTRARLVVITRSAVAISDSTGTRVRLTAAVVDARTGLLVWW